jgi:hypothetical protein
VAWSQFLLLAGKGPRSMPSLQPNGAVDGLSHNEGEHCDQKITFFMLSTLKISFFMLSTPALWLAWLCRIVSFFGLFCCCCLFVCLSVCLFACLFVFFSLLVGLLGLIYRVTRRPQP